MFITHYGHSCFQIQSDDLTIITDPFDPKIGLTPPQSYADVVTVSHQHYDHNYTSCIPGQPFIIQWPGEYEVKGIFIYGLESSHDNQGGKVRGKNIIFTFEIEQIKIAHLGDFGQDKLTDQQIEKLTGVDVLLIPVGGKYTIDGEKAAKITNQLEPKIVIPMHYSVPNLNIDLEHLEKFVKEIGLEPQKTSKLSIKKRNLDLGEETKLIVIE